MNMLCKWNHTLRAVLVAVNIRSLSFFDSTTHQLLIMAAPRKQMQLNFFETAVSSSYSFNIYNSTCHIGGSLQFREDELYCEGIRLLAS